VACGGTAVVSGITDSRLPSYCIAVDGRLFFFFFFFFDDTGAGAALPTPGPVFLW